MLTGNRLPISPDRVINGGATFSPLPFIDFAVDVKHVGTVQIDQRNTFQLDPYTLVDAAVTWRRGPLRVTLSGHNLFNTEYLLIHFTLVMNQAILGLALLAAKTESVERRFSKTSGGVH